MRNLIFAINLTIDGSCDHTNPVPFQELYPYHTRLVEEAGVLLYGRKTYQLMVPYWPEIAKSNSGDSEQANKFARAFDAVEKIIVFSKTLENANGNKTEIVRSGLKDKILELKQENGKPILTGGVDIPSQLIELGLVDEFHFVVHPLIAGKGRHLLETFKNPRYSNLKLVDSKIFKSGSVALHYLKNT